MGSVTVASECEVPGDLAHVWQFASDSDLINRVAGLPPVELEPYAADDSPARLLGRMSVFGMPVRFEEYPVAFERPHFTEWRRVLLDGPVREMVIRAELTPGAAGHTRVRASLRVETPTDLLDPMLRWMLGSVARDLAGAVVRMAEGARPPVSPVNAARLEAVAAQLAAHPEAPCADALVRHVREADDVQIQRIRPHALADALGLPRRAMLSTCVAAAEVGLLELAWILVCPSCRNGTEVLPSLQAVASDEGRCEACEVRFALDMDNAVEVVFAPHVAVRRYAAAVYCSGGPARIPHVLAQVNVLPGASGTLRAPVDPGHYRVVARGGGSVLLDVVHEAPEAVVVTPLVAAGSEGPATVRVASGGVVTAANPASQPLHVKLERLDRVGDAATARDVSTLAGFRRRFAADTLRPGVSLKVGRVALLFSDLADSTRLYGDMGDSTAFRVVQDHFEVLAGVIAARGGTVVKTIGDAVMAAFPDEEAAVGAGVDILAAFGPFRAAGEGRARTDIKLGVYAGPCYVVTANGVLDYFGQTVNTAARLQGIAASGELVVESRLVGSAAGLGASVGAAFPAALKGVGAPVEAVRVRWPATVPVPSSLP